MAYKDKDKQREANAERQRRYKARQKALPKQGVTEGVTQDGRIDITTCQDNSFEDVSVIPPKTTRIPTHKRGKPGDADYNGICTAEWRAERGR